MSFSNVGNNYSSNCLVGPYSSAKSFSKSKSSEDVSIFGKPNKQDMIKIGIKCNEIDLEKLKSKPWTGQLPEGFNPAGTTGLLIKNTTNKTSSFDYGFYGDGGIVEQPQKTSGPIPGCCEEKPAVYDWKTGETVYTDQLPENPHITYYT